jgi:hypothetical protein
MDKIGMCKSNKWVGSKINRHPLVLPATRAEEPDERFAGLWIMMGRDGYFV